MQLKSVWIGIALIILVSALGIGYFMVGQSSLRGSVIDPPLPASEINTTDSHGNTFRMSDMRGKVVLLYFGFVNCPDECPLTMAHIKQALDTLGTNAQDVQVVMVSTDPVRDTPQAMNDFLGRFSPAFLGIPGSPDDLAKIYKDYGVTVLEGGETHSSYTYMIDRSGNIQATFVPDTTPEDIAHDLKILLAKD